MSSFSDAGGSPTLLVLAGELSGDHHAGDLAKALAARRSDLRLVGTGGSRMRDAGVELIADLDDLAVMGFVEVIPRLLFFRKLRGRLERWLDEERPAAVVLVDYPGFNLGMARAAKERGIPVLYYIPPKAWAWREGRAGKLARFTDRVASILPFEPDFLRSHGVDANYVGNPLMEREDPVVDRAGFSETWGLDPGRPWLAVLPGSRKQEIAHHLGPFRDIAQRVVERRPDVLPVFSRAEGMSALPFHDLGFPVVTDTSGLLHHAEAGLVKSGTGTLEAAVAGLPQVIAYRSSPISVAIGLRVLRVDHIGLPNLVAGERVVPEIIQDDVRPEVVAPLLLSLLDPDSEDRARQIEATLRIRDRLGGPGAAERTADMVLDLLRGGAP